MAGYWGGDRALEKYLEQRDLEPVEPEPVYLVPLPWGAASHNESVALLTKGEDMWCLELNLPPRNMTKVLAFIATLAPEPEEDGDGHMCGVESHDGQHWAWIEHPGEVPMESVPMGMRLVMRDPVGPIFGRTSIGPFPTEEGAQDWLDKRNHVVRMKGP